MLKITESLQEISKIPVVNYPVVSLLIHVFLHIGVQMLT
jgi:hypothetical protein